MTSTWKDSFHTSRMKTNCAKMQPMRTFKSRAEISFPFDARRQPPLAVIQSLVAFGLGMPLHTCTWSGSSPSLDQKKTR